MVFIFLVLFVVSQTLPVMALIGGKWDLAICIEVPLLSFFMYVTYREFFRRCPVCGKRKVTIVSGSGGTRYITDNGICRNCKSHVSIMYDKEKLESTYYITDTHTRSYMIEPIWKQK